MSNILDKIKLSGTTYDIIDATAVHSLDGYYTSGQTNDAITAATAALAETIAEQGYQTSGDVQNAISGKADTSAVTEVNETLTAHTANTDIHVTSADKTNWNSVSGYADSVKYNETSHYMEFYHGTTAGTKVYEFDASPFLVDGMIEDVRIETLSGTTYLVIDFNTASGKEDIYIPLTDIFDPSNYYTKDEIDAALSGKADTSAVTASIEAAVSGKADTSAVTAVNDVLTAHTANTDIHVTTTDKSTWSGKQDALVSGTNIKTVNNQSLLGSGNIDVQSQPTVSGTTLIFS